MGDLEHINIKTEVVSDSEDVSDNSDEQHQELNILQQPFQGPFTNFTIEEILKPEFGTKKRRNEINHRLDHDSISCVSAKRHSARKKDENNQQHLSSGSSPESEGRHLPLPAWVYCTRYSDRPSSGPRSRKLKKKTKCADDKRPRTAFSNEQLHLLKDEFEKCQYLTEQRRKTLARDLKLSEGQIKIWFQNKRAKVKKTSGVRNILALHLMAQGLYNHASMSMDGITEDMMDDSM